MPVQKTRQKGVRVQILHFYHGFLSDIMTANGLDAIYRRYTGLTFLCIQPQLSNLGMQICAT